MAVNTTEIISTYSALYTEIKSKYDAMYAANEIGSQVYEELITNATKDLMVVATELVQKQEQIDKDNSEKDARIALITSQSATEGYRQTNLSADTALKNKQSTKVDEEIDLLQSQDLEVIASTDRSNLQSAKDLLVKQAQIDMIGAQQETESKRAAEVVAGTTLKVNQGIEVEKDTGRKNELQSKVVNKVNKEADLIAAQELESIQKSELLAQQKAHLTSENAKKLSMLDAQIDSAEAQATMTEEQLAQFQNSRGKMLQKLDAEVNALNTASGKVMGEIAILKSQHNTMEQRRSKDLSMLEEQLQKVQAETAMIDEQREQLLVSVGDNRKIRSLQAQADMLNGITMAKLEPTAGMIYEFYRASFELSGNSSTTTILGTEGSDDPYVLDQA